MKQNRVLVFSTDDHLYPAGGAEQAMGNITERLLHIEFDLICAKLRKGVKDYEKVNNVNIYRVGFGIPKIDGIILALFGHYYAFKLMRKYKYDFVWSIMASYGAFSAVRVKKKTGLPFLLTLQEGDSLEYIYSKVKYVRSSFNNIFKTADGIQAISKYLLAWGNEMGFAGTCAEVIPNGVAIDAFTREYTTHEIQQARESFGFPPESTILITSSRLEKKNGVGDVVSALPLLPQHVCFVICGSGSLDATIREYVTAHNLNDRVRFMGFVRPEQLPLFMHASDVFIRPSHTEGLGTAFLEAMAARIIVIGTNAGGIPDFLDDGKTGFCVKIGNLQSIVHGIVRATTLTTEERTAILDRAEQLVRERYDWNLISNQMEVLFNTLVT